MKFRSKNSFEASKSKKFCFHLKSISS